jgi:hypothetical protein
VQANLFAQAWQDYNLSAGDQSTGGNNKWVVLKCQREIHFQRHEWWVFRPEATKTGSGVSGLPQQTCGQTLHSNSHWKMRRISLPKLTTQWHSRKTTVVQSQWSITKLQVSAWMPNNYLSKRQANPCVMRAEIYIATRFTGARQDISYSTWQLQIHIRFEIEAMNTLTDRTQTDRQRQKM